MTHGITPEEWVDYLDGALAAAGRARIDEHLAVCSVCWSVLQDLMMAHEFLSEAAKDLRQHLTLTGRPLEPARGLQQLGRLRALMIPMCGAHTTRRAMDVAARRSNGPFLEAAAMTNWPVFMGHLTEIMVLLCGDPAAELVSRGGSRA